MAIKVSMASKCAAAWAKGTACLVKLFYDLLRHAHGLLRIADGGFSIHAIVAFSFDVRKRAAVKVRGIGRKPDVRNQRTGSGDAPQAQQST
jgi:hypothetical protein